MMPLSSRHGLAMALTFVRKSDSVGSFGISMHCPLVSNFQPWYTQRRPASSLRPKNSEAPRWGQLLATKLGTPLESRQTIRSSPSIRTRTGSPSGVSSQLYTHGSQYWRIMSPITVPAPTRHSSSVFSLESIRVPRLWFTRDGTPMEVDTVVEHLLKNAEWSASRSSGPGGQHRDKASTRAELTLGPESLVGLDENVAARLAEAFGLEDKPLRIAVQDERSLSRNQEIAAERLTERVAHALAPHAPPRRPTRPSRARRAARLDSKTRRGAVK